MILKNVNHINIVVKNFDISKYFFEYFLQLKRHSTDERAYLVGEKGPVLVVLEFPRMCPPDLASDRHQCFRGITFAVDSLSDLIKHAWQCGVEPFVFDDTGGETPISRDAPDTVSEDMKVSVRDLNANLWHFTAADRRQRQSDKLRRACND